MLNAPTATSTLLIHVKSGDHYTANNCNSLSLSLCRQPPDGVEWVCPSHFGDCCCKGTLITHWSIRSRKNRQKTILFTLNILCWQVTMCGHIWVDKHKGWQNIVDKCDQTLQQQQEWPYLRRAWTRDCKGSTKHKQEPVLENFERTHTRSWGAMPHFTGIIWQWQTQTQTQIQRRSMNRNLENVWPHKVEQCWKTTMILKQKISPTTGSDKLQVSVSDCFPY